MLGGYSSSKYRGGAATAVGVHGGAPEFTALSEYDKSKYHEKKRKVIKEIAVMFSKLLGIKGLENKPTEDLIKILQKNIKSTDSHQVARGAQKETCRALVQTVNNIYGRMIDTDLPEQTQCDMAFELVKSLFTANYEEFMEVSRQVNDRLFALSELETLLKAAREKIKKTVKGKLGSLDSSEFAAADNLMEETLLELSRQRAILANLLQSSMNEVRTNLELAFEKRAHPLNEFYEKLVPNAGPMEFGKKLSVLLGSLESVTNVTHIVQQALKTVGLSAKEFANMGSITELNKKLHARMVAMPAGSGAEELAKFVDASDMLRMKFSDKSVKNALAKVGGAAKKTQVARSLEAQEKLRERILKDATYAISQAYGRLVEEIETVSKNRDINPTKEVEQFYNALKRMTGQSAVTFTNADFLSAAMGRQLTGEMINQKREFLSLLNEINKRALAAGFKDIAMSVENIHKTIEQFTKIAEQIKTTKVTRGGAPIVPSCATTMSASEMRLKNAIENFGDMFDLSGMLLNMKANSTQLEKISKDYDKLLGRSIGSQINNIKKNYTKCIEKITANETWGGHLNDMDIEESIYSDGKTPGDSEKIESTVNYLKRSRDILVKFYKAVETVDMVLGQFVDNLSANPRAITKFKHELDLLELISQWSKSDTVESMRKLFESRGLLNLKLDTNKSKQKPEDLIKNIYGDVDPNTRNQGADVDGAFEIHEMSFVLDQARELVCGIAAVKNLTQFFITMGSDIGKKIVAPMSVSAISSAFNDYIALSMFECDVDARVTSVQLNSLKFKMTVRHAKGAKFLMYMSTDKLLFHTLNAMCSKVMVAASMYSVFHANGKHAKLSSPIRQIIGGGSAKVHAANARVYYSVVKAAEFYANVIGGYNPSNSKDKGYDFNRIVTVMPDDTSEFTPILRVVWYSKVSEGKYNWSQYNDRDVSDIVECCNGLAEKYKGKTNEETSHNVLRAFVSDVNSRFAMCVRSDFEDLRKLAYEKKSAEAIAIGNSSTQYNFSNEEPSYMSPPSDSFIEYDDITDFKDEIKISERHNYVMRHFRGRLLEALQHTDTSGIAVAQLYRAMEEDMKKDAGLAKVSRYIGMKTTNNMSIPALAHAQASYLIYPSKALSTLYELYTNALSVDVQIKGNLSKKTTPIGWINARVPARQGHLLWLLSSKNAVEYDGEKSYLVDKYPVSYFRDRLDRILTVYEKIKYAFTGDLKYLYNAYINEFERTLVLEENKLKNNKNTVEDQLNKIHSLFKNADVLLQLLMPPEISHKVTKDTIPKLTDKFSQYKKIYELCKKIPVSKVNTENIYGTVVDNTGMGANDKDYSEGPEIEVYDTNSVVGMFNHYMSLYLDIIYDNAMNKVYEDAILPLTNGVLNSAVFTGNGMRHKYANFAYLRTPKKYILQSLEYLEPLEAGMAFSIRKIVLERIGATDTPRYLTKIDGVSQYYKRYFLVNSGRILEGFERVLDICKNLQTALRGQVKSHNEYLIKAEATDYFPGANGDVSGVRCLRVGVPKLISACEQIINTIRKVQSDFGDVPKWGQLYPGSIDEFRSANMGKYPPAPPFLIAYEPNLPYNKDGDMHPNAKNDSEAAKALNAVRACRYGKQPLSETQGNLTLIESFNAATDRDNHITLSDVKKVVDDLQEIAKIPLMSIRDKDGPYVFLHASTVIDICQGRDTQARLFGVRSSIIDSGKTPRHISATTRAAASVFVEANVLPINVNMLRKTVPLANIYNFAYTFRTLTIVNHFGNKWFMDNMRNPYDEVRDTEEDTLQLAEYITGSMGTSIGRLKFIDMMWTDVIGGHLYPKYDDKDEFIVYRGGPPVTLAKMVNNALITTQPYVDANQALTRVRSRPFSVLCSIVNMHAFVDAFIHRHLENFEFPIARGRSALDERMLYLRSNQVTFGKYDGDNVTGMDKKMFGVKGPYYPPKSDQKPGSDEKPPGYIEVGSAATSLAETTVNIFDRNSPTSKKIEKLKQLQDDLKKVSDQSGQIEKLAQAVERLVNRGVSAESQPSVMDNNVKRLIDNTAMGLKNECEEILKNAVDNDTITALMKVKMTKDPAVKFNKALTKHNEKKSYFEQYIADDITGKVSGDNPRQEDLDVFFQVLEDIGTYRKEMKESVEIIRAAEEDDGAVFAFIVPKLLGEERDKKFEDAWDEVDSVSKKIEDAIAEFDSAAQKIESIKGKLDNLADGDNKSALYKHVDTLRTQLEGIKPYMAAPYMTYFGINGLEKKNIVDMMNDWNGLFDTIFTQIEDVSDSNITEVVKNLQLLNLEKEEEEDEVVVKEDDEGDEEEEEEEELKGEEEEEEEGNKVAVDGVVGKKDDEEDEEEEEAVLLEEEEEEGEKEEEGGGEGEGGEE